MLGDLCYRLLEHLVSEFMGVNNGTRPYCLSKGFRYVMDFSFGYNRKIIHQSSGDGEIKF